MVETPSPYEPDPGIPYGTCMDCELTFADSDSTREHMTETFEASHKRSGHRIRITNPSRSMRIENSIHRLMVDAVENNPGELDIRTETFEITDDALDQIVSGLEKEISRGWITEEEAAEVCSINRTIREAWEERD